MEVVAESGIETMPVFIAAFTLQRAETEPYDVRSYLQVFFTFSSVLSSCIHLHV